MRAKYQGLANGLVLDCHRRLRLSPDLQCFVSFEKGGRVVIQIIDRVCVCHCDERLSWINDTQTSS